MIPRDEQRQVEFELLPISSSPTTKPKVRGHLIFVGTRGKAYIEMNDGRVRTTALHRVRFVHHGR